MIAFHGDKQIKEKYLQRVKAHEKADEIIKGIYWENGKGCAVGCTIHSANHQAYETELGIPEALARLEDGIFESLPNDLAKTWPKRFLAAIEIGADLSDVVSKFMLWLLIDDNHGVINFARNHQQKEAIQSVADLYVLKLEGADIDMMDWMDARSAAYTYAAYYAAADAAVYAAAASATYYAAYYAADAVYAVAAVAAAASAADTYVARTNARIAQSEKLLELLKTAPVRKKGG